MSSRILWAVWGIACLFLAGVFLYAMLSDDPSSASNELFMPGTASDGHYQIAVDCKVCHVPFRGLNENACLQCHADELRNAKDTHSADVFGASHAHMLEKIDATRCVTCHAEHDPEITSSGGVSVSDQFCKTCHARIRQKSATHVDLTFDTCTGCHNYHDNRMLSEQFLRAHYDEPHTLPYARVPIPERPEKIDDKDDSGRPLVRRVVDVDVDVDKITSDWLESAHAENGVSCNDCHITEPKQGESAQWSEPVGPTVCAGCHARHVQEFSQSREGMRLAQHGKPMTAAEARLNMAPDVANGVLDCNSCHAPHNPDLQHAASNACIACHQSDHTQAHLDSRHHAMWLEEQKGRLPAGSGVSCATCHFPRAMRKEQGGSVMASTHNPNANLRPNEKMVETVCMHCHGARFALRALTDPAMIKNGFQGKPVPRKQAIERWVEQHGSLSAR